MVIRWHHAKFPGIRRSFIQFSHSHIDRVITGPTQGAFSESRVQSRNVLGHTLDELPFQLLCFGISLCKRLAVPSQNVVSHQETENWVKLVLVFSDRRRNHSERSYESAFQVWLTNQGFNIGSHSEWDTLTFDKSCEAKETTD
jgi:spore maturation protein CgeB